MFILSSLFLHPESVGSVQFALVSFLVGNTTHVEEEFTKLRQENQYLRSKLLKAEQEIEAVKVAHITIKDEKDRLKKQKRALQETLDGKHSPVDRSSTSSGSLRNRSQSLIGDRPISPSVVNRVNHSDSGIRM